MSSYVVGRINKGNADKITEEMCRVLDRVREFSGAKGFNTREFIEKMNQVTTELENELKEEAESRLDSSSSRSGTATTTEETKAAEAAEAAKAAVPAWAKESEMILLYYKNPGEKDGGYIRFTPKEASDKTYWEGIVVNLENLIDSRSAEIVSTYELHYLEWYQYRFGPGRDSTTTKMWVFIDTEKTKEKFTKIKADIALKTFKNETIDGKKMVDNFVRKCGYSFSVNSKFNIMNYEESEPSPKEKLKGLLTDTKNQIVVGKLQLAMIGYKGKKATVAAAAAEAATKVQAAWRGKQTRSDGQRAAAVAAEAPQIEIKVDGEESPINGTYTQIKGHNSWNKSDNSVFIRLTDDKGNTDEDASRNKYFTIFVIEGGEVTKFARSQAEVRTDETSDVEIYNVLDWVEFSIFEDDKIKGETGQFEVSIKYPDITSRKISVQCYNGEGVELRDVTMNGIYIETDESWVKKDGSFSIVKTNKTQGTYVLPDNLPDEEGYYFTLSSLTKPEPSSVPITPPFKLDQISLISKNKIEAGTDITQVDEWVNTNDPPQPFKLKFTDPVAATDPSADAAAASSATDADPSATADEPSLAPSAQPNWVQIANEQYDKHNSLKFDWKRNEKLETTTLVQGRTAHPPFAMKSGYPFWENKTYEMSMFIKEDDPTDREWRFKDKKKGWYYTLKTKTPGVLQNGTKQWVFHFHDGTTGNEIPCTVTLTEASPVEATDSQAHRLQVGGGLNIVGFNSVGLEECDGLYTINRVRVNGYPYYKKEGVHERHLFKSKKGNQWFITTSLSVLDRTTLVAYVDFTGRVPVGDKTKWNVLSDAGKRELILKVEEVPPSSGGGYKRRKSTINKYKRTTKNKYKRTMKKKYKRTMKKKYKKPTIKKYKRNINNKYNRTIKKKYKKKFKK